MRLVTNSLLFLLLTNAAYATTMVAVIDTGIDRESDVTHLCKQGHKSFVDAEPLHDYNGHGTHIAGLIEKNAGNKDYCLVSIKFYSDHNTGAENLANMIKALQYAINIHVSVINISGGGPDENLTERWLVKYALRKNIKVIVAAGNEESNLDAKCNYFPACYDSRLTVVGNLVKDKVRAKSSNYGSKVNRWEVGTGIISTLPHHKIGSMSGTSQATAIATGKLLSGF